MAAADLKDAGNAHFAAGRFTQAIEEYNKSLSIAGDGDSADRSLVANVHANIAACLLKLSAPSAQVIAACDKAIEINPGHAKALFRRGQAYENEGELARALADIRAVLHQEPKNKAASDAAQRISGHIRAQQSSDPVSQGMKVAQGLGQLHGPALITALAELCRYTTRADVCERLLGYPQLIALLCKQVCTCASRAGQTSGLKALTHMTLPSEAAKEAVSAAICGDAVHIQLVVGLMASADADAREWAVRLCARIASLPKTAATLCDNGAVEHALTALGYIATPIKALDQDAEPKGGAGAGVGAGVGIGAQGAPGSGEGQGDHGLEFTLECLAQLAQSKQGAEAFAKGDGLSFIYPLCGEDRAGIRARVCMLFQRVVDHMMRAKADYTEEAVLPKVMYALSWAKTDEDKCRAAGGVSVLAQTMDGGDKLLVNEGAPFKLVKWLQAAASGAAAGRQLPPSDTRVCRMVTQALCDLSTSESHQGTIIEAGALPLLLSLSASPTTSLCGVASACLARLATFSRDTRDIIVEEGGPELMIQLLDDPDADVSVQRLATEGLSFLALTAEARAKLSRPEMIAALSKLSLSDDAVVQYGVASTLNNAMRKVKTEFDDEEQAALKRLQLQTEGPATKEQVEGKFESLRKQAADAEAATDAFRVQFVAAGGVRVLCNLAKCESLAIQHLVADTLFALSINAANRGHMVQQGALRSLYNLGCAELAEGTKKKAAPQPLPYSKGADKPEHKPATIADVQEKAAHAIAKIGVTTDPKLYPEGVVHAICKPLIRLANGVGELEQFEAAIALTNIATLGPDIKDHIVREGGWRAMEYLCASENPQVQRMAVGALTNLVLCEEMFTRILDKTKEEAARLQPLKILVVLSGAEDAMTCRYAMGGLANLCNHSEEMVPMIVQLGGITKAVKLLEEAVTDAFYPALLFLLALCGESKDYAADAVRQGVLPPLLLIQEGGADVPADSVPVAKDLVLVLNKHLKTPTTIAEAAAGSLS